MNENYFSSFRKDIIGIDAKIDTPFAQQIPMVYADWTASGRSFGPIEDRIRNEFLPLIANTHTETTTTGMAMTHAYKYAHSVIKKHVHANAEDVLITCGSGMTGVVNKFQRILGLKVHEKYRQYIPKEDRPVVFVSHMEHHSNQTSWMETIAEVIVVPPNSEGLVDLLEFRKAFEKYKTRSLKIAAVTSCSNVTGIMTPYHEIAELIHEYGGFCFVDFACSAPYIEIDMHPHKAEQSLDAIYFSPHKFLGGPGSTGVLVFNKILYKNTVPDHPGGGTVYWTNPWGITKYLNDIEAREDGGTPAFLQTIKTAMALRLKEIMGSENILKREEEMLEYLLPELEKIKGLHILAAQHRKRLGVISFYIDDLNFNLAVKMLNDRFGIQTRGGCSCAGTYGHYLLHINEQDSTDMMCEIESGDHHRRPGWVRLSIHPTMTNKELRFIVDSIKSLARNHQDWASDYKIDVLNQVRCNDQRADQKVLQHMEDMVNNPLVESELLMD
ncbi:aminotransferase class V-fold PLP-dependent enzyme [bacterium]|nr:aminotransferase class V-fold PLP-dependent enzyme [bacterium]